MAQHAGQFRLGDHVVLQADVVAGIGITLCLDHKAVIIEHKLACTLIGPKCVLIKGHVGLKELKVQHGVESFEMAAS